MSVFHYQAVTQSGSRIEGEIDADDRKSALEQLKELGYLPIDVRAGALEVKSRQLFTFGPSRNGITLLTRELAMLLQAGITLDTALAMLVQNQEQKKLSNLVSKIRQELSSGASFADALQRQGSIFPPVYISMVRVGETHGRLQDVLEQIAETREREQKLRAKLGSALLYPCFLVVAAFVMIALLMLFVIPGFRQIIMSTGAEIPAGARLVLDSSDWLQAHITQLAMIGLITILLVKALADTAPVRAFREFALFNIPVLGRLVRMQMTVTFCRTLGTLLKGGVELVDALVLCQNVLPSQRASNAIGESINALRRGQDFIKPLESSKIFPPVAINMLRVSEETGNLSNGAFYLCNMFEEKSDTAIRRTLTILGPLIIISVSLLVAGILIAILGAIVSVNDLVI